MSGVAIEQIKGELLEHLRGHGLTSGVVREIGSSFHDFASALSNNDIRSLLRATTLIHHLVLGLIGNENAGAFCDRLQSLIPDKIKTVTQALVRRELFFVWIGSINSRSLRNIL